MARTWLQIRIELIGGGGLELPAPPGRVLLGEDWDHHCEILLEKVDPLEEYGARPAQPVPVMGWGWIPDQYGREGDDEAE